MLQTTWCKYHRHLKWLLHHNISDSLRPITPQEITVTFIGPTCWSNTCNQSVIQPVIESACPIWQPLLTIKLRGHFELIQRRAKRSSLGHERQSVLFDIDPINVRKDKSTTFQLYFNDINLSWTNSKSSCLPKVVFYQTINQRKYEQTATTCLIA